MGFQLLYWQYLQSINHPILKLLDKSPQSFVGEDIELSLMLLAYFTSSTNITRKTARVDDAYQSLGLLSQIAKQVRDYKISRFGGATKARTAIVYDAQNDAVIKTTEFVRKWIQDTEERGLYAYKRSSIIPSKKKARKEGRRLLNAESVDLDWKEWGQTQLSRHLSSLETKAYKTTQEFDAKYLKNFRDRYAFNDDTMERFPNELNSDSSMDELPLNSDEWQLRMSAMVDSNSQEAKEREQKRRVAAIAERDEKEAKKNAPRPRGRPRKNPLPAPAVPVVLAPQNSAPQQLPVQKKKRGRPKGSKNKLKKGVVRETKTRTAQNQKTQDLFERSLVFDADDEGDTRFLFGFIFILFLALTQSIHLPTSLERKSYVAWQIDLNPRFYLLNP